MADKKFSKRQEPSGPGIFLAKSLKSVILPIQGVGAAGVRITETGGAGGASPVCFNDRMYQN